MQYEYAQLKQVGGMVGTGHGANATDFAKTYHQVAQIMGYSHVAMGTDVVIIGRMAMGPSLWCCAW